MPTREARAIQPVFRQESEDELLSLQAVAGTCLLPRHAYDLVRRERLFSPIAPIHLHARDGRCHAIDALPESHRWYALRYGWRIDDSAPGALP